MKIKYKRGDVVAVRLGRTGIYGGFATFRAIVLEVGGWKNERIPSHYRTNTYLRPTLKPVRSPGGKGIAVAVSRWWGDENKRPWHSQVVNDSNIESTWAEWEAKEVRIKELQTKRNNERMAEEAALESEWKDLGAKVEAIIGRVPEMDHTGRVTLKIGEIEKLIYMSEGV